MEKQDAAGLPALELTRSRSARDETNDGARHDYSLLGTDGTPSVYPLWGRNQELVVDLSAAAAQPAPSSAELKPSPTGVRAYAVALTAAALATLGGLLASGAGIGTAGVVVALAAVAALAERGTVRLSSSIEESISAVPMLFAAVLFGPLAALIVGAASMLGDFTRPYLRWTIYTSSRAITGALVGALAFAVQDAVGSWPLALGLSTLLAAVVAQLLDTAFAVITLRLRKTGDLRDTIRLVLPVAAAAIPLYAPVVGFLALAYTEISPWATMLFIVPAVGAQRLYILYQAQRELAEGLGVANDRLERANLSFAAALVATLDARDQYTAGHSAAVAVYSRDIAERMGLSDRDQQRVHLCGLVHDIGKIGLAAGLLEKPGPLTLEERRQMQEHAVIGERILRNVDDYADVSEVVRHHHERVDGHGYPDGLEQDNIPLLSRIIAVADAYNAMTSDRPYREGMPSRVARLRLAQAVESQFDTAVVAAFEAILASADEAYQQGTRIDFLFSAEVDRAQERGSLTVVA